MADEGTKPGEAEGKSDVQKGEPKEHDDTVTIRKGEYNGLKTQLKQLQKERDEFNAAKSADEAAKLKAAADWESLEKKKTAELESVKAELEKTRRSVITAEAKSALLGAGMRAGLTANGALSMLPSDIDADGIAAWVNDIKTQFPDEFKAPVTPIGAPSVGATGKPTTDEASALKAKVAATKGKGPAAMEAVMREVNAYIAAHGKNPLA